MPWESRQGSSKLYFIQKKRLGGDLVSIYYGTGESAENIARAEQHDQRFRLIQREETSAISQALISLNAANEAQFQAVETQLIEAFAAAGYHRQCRGPWRKARSSNYSQAPVAERLRPNDMFEILLPIEPLLTGRIRACRKHCAHVKAMYEIAQIGSAAVIRLYIRTAARAARRLRSAEASLSLLHKIAIGD